MFSLSSAAGVPARKQAINVILPEVLVLPRPLFLLTHKDGGGLLLKKYTQGFEEDGLTITMQ